MNVKALIVLCVSTYLSWKYLRVSDREMYYRAAEHILSSYPSDSRSVLKKGDYDEDKLRDFVSDLSYIEVTNKSRIVSK